LSEATPGEVEDIDKSSQVEALEEQQQVRKLLRTKRRRLNAQEVKAGSYGLACPTELALELEDLRKEVEDLDKRLTWLAET
jgi:hypothetical protein